MRCIVTLVPHLYLLIYSMQSICHNNTPPVMSLSKDLNVAFTVDCSIYYFTLHHCGTLRLWGRNAWIGDGAVLPLLQRCYHDTWVRKSQPWPPIGAQSTHHLHRRSPGNSWVHRIKSHTGETLHWRCEYHHTRSPKRCHWNIEVLQE